MRVPENAEGSGTLLEGLGVFPAGCRTPPAELPGAFLAGSGIRTAPQGVLSPKRMPEAPTSIPIATKSVFSPTSHSRSHYISVWTSPTCKKSSQKSNIEYLLLAKGGGRQLGGWTQIFQEPFGKPELSLEFL